ncbi:MAG: hypothetical protein ACRDOF_10525 [Gaiellaceae bacterium]
MERFGVEDVGEVPEVEVSADGRLPETAPASYHAPQREAHEQVGSSEHEEPLTQLRRLEAELERYREHAQRTSKLFLSVTKYVEWVRENARADAELALRKASARVEKLDRATRELEETELELARARDDLARLQAVTEEARARLSAFLAAGLQALDTSAGAARDVGERTSDGIEDRLHAGLAADSMSDHLHATPVDGPRQ